GLRAVSGDHGGMLEHLRPAFGGGEIESGECLVYDLSSGLAERALGEVVGDARRAAEAIGPGDADLIALAAVDLDVVDVEANVLVTFCCWSANDHERLNLPFIELGNALN